MSGTDRPQHAALTAEEVAFRYSSAGPWIFRNFSFTLRPGEILAVLGPNGRGKTTLLKLLLQILRPLDGRIFRSGRWGYVPQVSAPAFDYKVLDMVVMGRAGDIGIFSVPGAEDYLFAEEALSRLGIHDLARCGYSSLSGGQRQLVLIARALVSRPCGLILDEPASALDFKNQDVILSTLKQLSGEGLAIVMTTHAPQHALHVADRVLVLESDTRHIYGSPTEIMTGEQLFRLYGIKLKTMVFNHDGAPVRGVVPIFS